MGRRGERVDPAKPARAQAVVKRAEKVAQQGQQKRTRRMLLENVGLTLVLGIVVMIGVGVYAMRGGYDDHSADRCA